MLWACCTATLHSSRTVPCAFTKKSMQVCIVTVTVVKAEAQRYPCRVVLMDGDVKDRRPQSRQLLSNFLSKPPQWKCHTPFSGWTAHDEWILIQSRCAVRWLGAEAQWWSLGKRWEKAGSDGAFTLKFQDVIYKTNCGSEGAARMRAYVIPSKYEWVCRRRQ